jgi:hypothetical protein
MFLSYSFPFYLSLVKWMGSYGILAKQGATTTSIMSLSKMMLRRMIPGIEINM